MASFPFSVSCEADEIIAEIARIDARLGGVRPDTIIDMRGVDIAKEPCPVAETWRVVLADGTVRSVCVSPGGGGYYATDESERCEWSTSQRAAVLRLAAEHASHYDVVEVLAPGESSRRRDHG